MSFRIGVVSLLIALFIFQAYGKSVKHTKHVKASKKQIGCGGGCPQQCAPACQQSCCGQQGSQAQIISHLTTVHHHHVHHMAPAPPAPPPAPLPPPPPPQTFHTQQHVFECDQPPCPVPPQPMASPGACATPPCGGGIPPQQPCGAPPCGK